MTPDFTISACEDVLLEFEVLDPKGLLDAVHEELEAEGMLRPGDEERHRALREWFEGRLTRLPAELEDNHEPPPVCPDQVDCSGYCDYFENCGNNCEPPPSSKRPAGAGGADGAGGNVGEPVATAEFARRSWSTAFATERRRAIRDALRLLSRIGII